MEERHTLFGKYEMGRLLGKGTFAKVYYGKQVVSGDSVAIKVISKDQVKPKPINYRSIIYEFIQIVFVQL